MLARVPWTPPLKDRPKPRRLNRDRRKHLVETVVFIIRNGCEEGQPSKFWCEGPMRHDVRARLCLDGWPWTDADKAAGEIMEAALRQVGAVRPSWQDGQPEYVQFASAAHERTRCLSCGGRLPPENKIFCSSNCNHNYHRNRHREDNAELFRAKQRLRWKDWSAKQPEQDCPECGTAFRPNYPGQLLCSKRCAILKMQASRRLTRARP